MASASNLFIARSLLLLAASAVAGCPGSGDDAPSDTDAATEGMDGTGGGSADDGGATSGNDETAGDDAMDATADTGEPDVPHALGTIVLGEVHPAQSGNSTPVVSAVFLPDSAGASSQCSDEVAGCEIMLTPDCGSTGCDTGEYCGFDDGCQASCLAICDAECGDDEVCYFASPGNAACKVREAFDAGALTFVGTTTALTLFPPYSFQGEASGAPFAPGADLAVSASGATAAGFTAFDRAFTATDLLQSDLEDISITHAYGDGDIPITWIPGDGDLKISASVVGFDGASGLVTCEGNDASGEFAFPREAIDAAIGGETLSSITLTIERRRTDMHRDLETTGQLLGATVQEVGWLELVTSSAESHAVQGCGPGEAVCGGDCVDVSSDPDNCGGCGESCSGQDSCYDGTCNGPAACNACAAGEPRECAAEFAACEANPECVALGACLGPCTTADCQNACVEANPAGLDDYNNRASCLCYEGCANECSGLC